MRTFSWLHLTDLHRGMDAQAWLWPGVKDIFLEDLTRLHERCGPWDLVLFTGDITQHGAADEFDGFTATLAPIWRHIEGLGPSPALLVVPGNHDLARPDPRAPEALILQRWAEFPGVHDDFWADPESPYRRLVDRIFANYSAWLARSPFPRPSKTHGGILPGDFSSTITKDGVSLGILGLNSTWLQIGGGDYEGKLVIDVRQFNGACGGDGPAWVKEHEVNLLLTHHPVAWLSGQARDHFHGEIFTPGRFAAHICGHLHEHAQTVVAIGGAKGRRQIQGRSLFGLERFGPGAGQTERSHGYSVGVIAIDDQGAATLRVWPRVAKRAAAGHWRLLQDLDAFELRDDHGTEPEALPLQRRPDPPRSPRPSRPLAGVADRAPVDNPFHIAGTMPPDAPSYVRRACDDALAAALRDSPLIVVEGEYQVGKSSLLTRACTELDMAYRCCFVDCGLYGTHDERVFMRSLFRGLSKALKRQVDDWSELDGSDEPPLALILDELGNPTPGIAQQLFPPLFNLSRVRPQVRVIYVRPAHEGDPSVDRWLAGLGVTHPKHRAPWRAVVVPRFGVDEIGHLLDLLPLRARRLVHADELLHRSGGLPVVVQRVCSALFDAAVTGATELRLRELLEAKESYAR